MARRPIVIAFSGKKGAGKDTIASFVMDCFKKFSAWQFGCPSSRFPQERHVICLAFAYFIKKFCMEVLGLTYQQCYGSDVEKNTSTKYAWKDTPQSGQSGFMTAREVMQIFGTECVRSWFGNVWAEATLRKILQDQPNLALITDNRFPNEVETILDYPGGYIVRLTRCPYEEDEHASEISLDGFDWDRAKCYLLDNKQMSLDEQNTAILPIITRIFQQELNK